MCISILSEVRKKLLNCYSSTQVTDEVEIMSQKVLFIKLLLLHYATLSRPQIYANCNEDATVMCPVLDIDSMDFMSVAWYKINQTKIGIIRKGKDNKTMRYSNFIRSIKPRFGEKHSLLIPSVTPEDSGTYECEISANIGGQNQYLEVQLTVYECETDMTTITTVLNATLPNLLCHKPEEDIPVMWSILGYSAVGFVKIILSLISIQVIQAVRMRSSRRRQHKW
ncbi:uncharacterized protein LOC129100230 [Anoplopoma fimbria]|uniref:uncharacterized protein LOC129100230 n=1 Tax=Anoplopoma fimbria TaxID=229290 RepID=UPI0023EAD3D0|nr:uncharacterized protein LOC129100230 [Anoplopoma fimbria]